MILSWPKSHKNFSVESREFKCNLIDDDNNKYDNNIVLISNKVIFRMSNKDGMDDKNCIWNEGGNGSKSGKNISTVGKWKWKSSNDNKWNTRISH